MQDVQLTQTYMKGTEIFLKGILRHYASAESSEWNWSSISTHFKSTTAPTPPVTAAVLKRLWVYVSCRPEGQDGFGLAQDASDATDFSVDRLPTPQQLGAKLAMIPDEEIRSAMALLGSPAVVIADPATAALAGQKRSAEEAGLREEGGGAEKKLATGHVPANPGHVGAEPEPASEKGPEAVKGEPKPVDKLFPPPAPVTHSTPRALPSNVDTSVPGELPTPSPSQYPLLSPGQSVALTPNSQSALNQLPCHLPSPSPTPQPNKIPAPLFSGEGGGEEGGAKEGAEEPEKKEEGKAEEEGKEEEGKAEEGREEEGKEEEGKEEEGKPEEEAAAA